MAAGSSSRACPAATSPPGRSGSDSSKTRKAASDGREGWRKIRGGRLDGLGDRDRQVAVTLEDVARADHRQADDALRAWCVADDVALRRLLPLAPRGLTDVQVEHVVLGVVIGVVEDHGADSDAHSLHETG